MSQIDIDLEADEIRPCPCGCGESFRCLVGGFHRDGRGFIFKLLLAKHEGQAQLHWLFGTGSWWPDRDERDCLVTVQTWCEEGFQSGLTAAEQSLWKSDPLFSNPNKRHLDRAEVLSFEPGAGFVFRMIDRILLQFQDCRTFLLEDHFKATEVTVCPHVLDERRPVLLVTRFEGDWQLLCGGLHDGEPKTVGLGQLLAADASLAEILDLGEYSEAERETVGGIWMRRELEDDRDPARPPRSNRLLNEIYDALAEHPQADGIRVSIEATPKKHPAGENGAMVVAKKVSWNLTAGDEPLTEPSVSFVHPQHGEDHFRADLASYFEGYRCVVASDI